MAEPEPPRRNVLLRLAAEGVLPALGGAAGAAVEGPVGGVVGVAAGRAVEKAINLVGRGIVDRWGRWFAAHPSEAREAVAELAATPPGEARAEAKSLFLELAPDADESDLAWAVEYLSALPCAVDRALVPDAAGGRSVPPTVALDDPRSLLQLLPEDVPPFGPGADLPGTPYRLVELLGAGGFGAVYRAVSPTLQHLPLAIKFCLDRSLVPALNQERSNLERLMRAGGRGAAHVVRLYGYDLDHSTPYLVYEYVEGGDLTKLLAARRAEGRPPAPGEVLGWITQIADGLAFAHRAGLVHRDLKPANILAEASGGREPPGSEHEPGGSRPPLAQLKLADFGLGGVAAVRAAARSRIGTTTIDFLSLADQASLFRGAGTPLYMSPEQRRGAPPDPRHDLYALGVVWFQLLVGDVSRELHHGWAKELAVRFGVPAGHISLIERCVGWFDERPKDANELLPLLREATADPSAQPPPRNGEGEEAPSRGFSGPPPPRGEGLGEGSGPNSPSPGGGRGVGSGSGTTPTLLNTSQVTPVPVPPSGTSEGRRRGLTAALARLQSAYTELDDLKHWRFNTTLQYGLLLGLLVGWLVGEFVYAVKIESGYFPAAFRASPFDWLSVVLGVGVGLLVWGGYVWVIRSGVVAVAADLRQKVEGVVGEIVDDFPDEVAAWGGRASLRHPATVRQFREGLDRPAPAAPEADDLAADPTRRAALAGRLADHAETLAAVDRAAARARVGVWLAWVVLTPSVAVAVYTLTIDPQAKRPGPEVWAAAGAAGLVVAGLVWVAGQAVRGVARGAAAVSADRLAAEYPRAVAAWGGRAVLDSRAAVRRLREELDPPVGPARPLSGPSSEDLAADPTKKVLLVARLRDHDRLLDNATDAVIGSWVGVSFLGPAAALGAGLAAYHAVYRPARHISNITYPAANEEMATLAAVLAVPPAFALVCWVMWLVRRYFRRRAAASRDRFIADYPRLVDGWGGPAALGSRETVGALIRMLDPAVAAQPGWLRRLFGG